MKMISKALNFCCITALFALCYTYAWSHKISGVRIGDHATYTRIVFDVSQKPNFKLSLAQKGTEVRLFASNLQCNKTLPKATGKLVKNISFTAFRTGVGEFKFHTTKSVKVIKSFAISPSKSTPHFRYVVDLQETIYVPAKKVAPPPPPKPKIKKKVIVIDAGHGGKDPGAKGRGGILEKNVTLSVAKILKNTLSKTGRYDVRMTRNADRYLKLSRRVAIARAVKADFFISLHADSHPRSDTRGLSVYTLSKVASDKEAEKLAIKENKADLIDSVDLNTESPEVANILIDLMKRETMNLSRKAANHMVGRLRKRVLLLRNTIRSANFAVLRTPELPAVLIEMGYISNRQDEKLLTTPNHQLKLCAGIREGIDSYFAEHK